MNELKKNHLWQVYQKAIVSKDIPPLEDIGISGLRFSRQRHFMQNLDEKDRLDLMTLDRLKEKWRAFNQSKDQDVMGLVKKSDEQKMLELGLEFLEAAKWGDLKTVQSLYEPGFPINFQHPRHRMTALHWAAARNNLPLSQWLVDTGECDLLLLDFRLKTAWDNVSFYCSHNEELNNLLGLETHKQAKEAGLNWQEDHKRRFKIWIKSEWFAEYVYFQSRDNEL